MFTSESLHSEFKHGGVEVEMVVVECYCFLLNIIVDTPESHRALRAYRTGGANLLEKHMLFAHFL